MCVGDRVMANACIRVHRGSNFLLHIERQVGGLDVFRPYIKAYIKKFAGNVVTTEQWRAHLYEFFGKAENGKELVKKLDEIKWDEVSGLHSCRVPRVWRPVR